MTHGDATPEARAPARLDAVVLAGLLSIGLVVEWGPINEWLISNAALRAADGSWLGVVRGSVAAGAVCLFIQVTNGLLCRATLRRLPRLNARLASIGGVDPEPLAGGTRGWVRDLAVAFAIGTSGTVVLWSVTGQPLPDRSRLLRLAGLVAGAVVIVAFVALTATTTMADAGWAGPARVVTAILSSALFWLGVFLAGTVLPRALSRRGSSTAPAAAAAAPGRR